MPPTETFDLIVVGAGPGGYVAAARAAQLGLKTAVIDEHDRLGGVCLRVGCIPSKALLDSSELYHLARERLKEHGIHTGDVRLDLAAMMARKDKVVDELTRNVRSLLEGHKVTLIRGTARLAGPDRVAVAVPDGATRELGARHILLATGSEPVALPDIPFDGDRIVTSTDALAFKEVPRHLGIVGGGYIGLELGSVWARLGARVTVIEMMPAIAAGLDGQVRRTLQRILGKQGFTFRLKSRVTAARVEAGEVAVTLASDGREERLTVDRLLVAAGRRPLTRGLNLAEVGVKTDDAGRVIVDEAYRTHVPSVYAIGDLIAGPMLAHKASFEGIAAVEGMAGLPGEVNYDAIPAVIYTWPEVASVGLTEEAVKERELPFCTGTFPFSGAGRARCMGETEGFVKVVTHARTDRLLGIHILGPRASDMIAEGVLALEFGAASEDIARTVHGHPTFAEALQEAAMAVRNCSIYVS